MMGYSSGLVCCILEYGMLRILLVPTQPAGVLIATSGSPMKKSKMMEKTNATIHPTR